MGEKLSRRDVLKFGIAATISTFLGAKIIGLINSSDIEPVQASLPDGGSNAIGKIDQQLRSPRLTTETVSQNRDWGDKLVRDLGDGYLRKNPSEIWYSDQVSGRKSPVLLQIDKDRASFQYQDRLKRESGRETVRYVEKNHVYVLSESQLVAVSNYDKRVFTFNEQSQVWREAFGDKVVSSYEKCSDGSMKILVWSTNEKGEWVVVDSGVSIDATGGLSQGK